MIDSLYNLTRKGWLKALSFILATAMFIIILMNSALFTRYFGGNSFYRAIIVFYGMSILWIHGIGFEIRSKLWRSIFLPLVGYILVGVVLVYLTLLK